MGATIVGNVIYIDKDLDARLTERERRVIKAHEVCHYLRRDRLRKALFLCIPIFGLLFANAFSRHLEIIADRFAIMLTKVPYAFISLMDKLQHNSKSHPTKEQRVKLARSFL